jgi:hypothetical protein
MVIEKTFDRPMIGNGKLSIVMGLGTKKLLVIIRLAIEKIQSPQHWRSKTFAH